MRTLRAALIVTYFAVTLAGCANYTAPIGPVRELTPAERNFEAIWQASQQVLRKYYFTVDRKDRRAGTIVTDPMTGQYFTEFWRRDATTESDLREGAIQTLYRQVKVAIQPLGPEAKEFRAAVEVQTFRSNRQEAQVTSTSEAIDLFRLPDEKSRKKGLLDYGRGEAADTSVPLGRDEGLERRIAAEILAAARELRGKL